MDQYVTGAVVRELREQRKMTQAELAACIAVSDKTVSKWETGKGYPDITLLEPLAEALRVSITELLSGHAVSNMNVSANMMRSKFYICPVCGNVIHSMGEAVMQCHGVLLTPAEPEQAESAETGLVSGRHAIRIEMIEDEYFVEIPHEMSKQHYISFIAAASSDRFQMVKLYPESAAEARFKLRGVEKIFFYCNRDGLFEAGPTVLRKVRKGLTTEKSRIDEKN